MRAVVTISFFQKKHLCSLIAAIGFILVVAFPLHSQTLHGQVVDSVNTEPLSGIEVVLLDSQRDTVAVTRSGADGRFALAVPDGSYTLCVRCIGHRPKQLPVEVPSEQAVLVLLAPLSIPLNP
jgi:hypothetical protein